MALLFLVPKNTDKQYLNRGSSVAKNTKKPYLTKNADKPY